MEKLKVQIQTSNATIDKLKAKMDEQENNFIERTLVKDKEISQMKSQLQFLSSDYENMKLDSEKIIIEKKKTIEKNTEQFKKRES